MKTATFDINNINTKVTTDPELIAVLDDAFCYYVEGYKHMPKFKEGKWDGKKHLLHQNWKTFPTGLLEDAQTLAVQHNYSIIVNDLRQVPDVKLKPLFLRGADERDHQIEAIEAAIEIERGIIWHSTGSGKTNTMAGIIQVLNQPTILLVHSNEIARQTRERFIKLLGRRDIGLYTGGTKTDGFIVCATFQTLMSQYRKDKKNGTNQLKRWLDKFNVLCIDEGHHTLALTYQAVINECNAYFRFGFSATPTKSIDMKSAHKGARLHLIGSTGPVLDQYKAGEGVEDGYLVMAKVKMYQWHPDNPRAGWKADDYVINDRNYTYTGKKTELVEKVVNGKTVQVRVPLPESKWKKGLYDVAIAEHYLRNERVLDKVIKFYQQGLTTLVLCERIKHGMYLQSELKKRLKCNVLFLQGEDSKGTREMSKMKFSSGEIPILIATTIFDEGVDIPAIDGLVLAAGGKAHHRTIQRLGRGMRPKEGKIELHVADFMDTHSRAMWRHSNERKKVYNSDDGAYKCEVVRDY